MKFASILLLAIVAMALLASVNAGASDKITQLKARVSAEESKTPAVQGKLPCKPAPTQKLPVTLVGVADQMPGDKEANEILINRVDQDVKNAKAKIIKEKVLKDSEAAVQRALEVQDDFHQFQAKVLREPTLPRLADQ